MGFYSRTKTYLRYLFAPDFTDGNVDHYNWWSSPERNSWFSAFIKHHFYGSKQKINIYSVFGPPQIVSMYHKKHRKIFFTGENIHMGTERNRAFNDLCLQHVDLSLGFDYLNADNYIRFPLWITYIIPPSSDENMIRETVRSINEARSSNLYSCALIASHDTWKTRCTIYDSLRNILEIKCPGKWNHNTDDLWNKYRDNKLKFLHNFKFNICPENTNTYGYVTEKLFDAMRCGCVPIYSGSDNRPEPGLIDPDSVIFWDDAYPQLSIDKITLLSCQNNAYEDFISRQKLTSMAVEYISERLSLLHNAIAKMLD